jgi:phosphoserine phosphatase
LVFIATLIAKHRLSSGDISSAEDVLAAAGIQSMGRSWIEADRACDILFSASPSRGREALEGVLKDVDVIVQGEAGRRKRLLVADMDSTMITIECIDELADYAGIKPQIAEITERAMRGELEFEAALDERVGLLKDLDEKVLERCHAERVEIMGGAIPLVRTMKRNGSRAVLVSGGFTHFADRVGRDIGFDTVISNQLGLFDGKLDGTVVKPIVDSSTKRRTLVDTAAEMGVDMADTMAVGDGANDIPMLEAAGLGIAYHAKPKTAAAAAARVEHNDLTALLFAQGYARSEWVSD